MPEAPPALRRELRLWDLVLFNISAVAGVRWIAAAAHAGPGSLSLWVLAALLFFIPSALVIAGLSEKFPEEGGMYVWGKRAFGDWHGFLCAWFYFVSNLLYFPGLLLAGVSMGSYALGFDATQAPQYRVYVIPITLVVLWIAILANLFGLRVAKWTGILGGSSTYLVGALIVAFGVFAWFERGSVTRFHFAPAANWDTLNFWSQIAFAFIGLELGAILGGEIRNPRRTLPRAAWISGVACAVFYMAGTAAMLVLLKPEDVNPVTGLAQAGHVAGERFSLGWLSPCFAILIAVGIFGQLGSYLAGNTRLPFAIGLDHYLPPAFAKLHPRWGTPYVSLFTQAFVATVFLVAAQLGENLRAGYQILVDMSVITGFIPYVYIFASGMRFGFVFAGLSGLLVSLLAIILSMAPPPGIASVWIFETKILGACVVLGLVGLLIFKRSKAA
jgi:amino acid transporter